MNTGYIRVVCGNQGTSALRQRVEEQERLGGGTDVVGRGQQFFKLLKRRAVEATTVFAPLS